MRIRIRFQEFADLALVVTSPFDKLRTTQFKFGCLLCFITAKDQLVFTEHKHMALNTIMVVYIISLILWPYLAIQDLLFQTAEATKLGGNEQNIPLNACDSILVGNPKQGIYASCYYPKI